MKVNRTKDTRMRMCSRLARESGEDIVGHAFGYDRIVIAEMPKPWPRDTSGARGYARVPGLVGCLYPGQTIETPQYRVLSFARIS